ncbi:MAG: Gfo/Idh/MocA family oxidoreductase [Bacteroidota bacterium]
MNRRNFITTTGTAAAGTLLTSSASAMNRNSMFSAKKRIALVGTGIRGITFWGKNLVDEYGDLIEFVGLCDINPGRVEFGKKFIGVNCPVFVDFNKMMQTVKPDMLIVCTVDATHHEFIIKGLEMGVDVITEKPLTTDEYKCQRILDAERKSGKKLIVGFNYRYNPHYTKLRELIAEERVGKITSVDFNWYLNTYHGASYYRRWHGERNMGGTLLVHKSTHHFDLLNWWLNSDPVEVTAYGMLDHYGSNNNFRGVKCRECPHTDKCEFYYDITKDKTSMDLYVAYEKHDGYIRDNCVWRHDIDIYDKMAVQIKYANDVVVNYSLTTYSPYEGMRIAFNGFNGRLDAWDGIPWRKEEKLSQAELHAKEMSQDEKEGAANYEEIMIGDNFKGTQLLKVPRPKGGHGGGDKRLQDKIFRNPDMADPLKHSAGSRDGAMSILVGIAARKSIELNRPVRIEELTDIKPHPTRGA